MKLLLVGVSSAPSCCMVWDRDLAALTRLPVLHLERLESIHDDAKHELGFHKVQRLPKEAQVPQ
ncbi:MAG: hypothetical protein LM590_13900 [Thermofilum sp.]|nr:hypothetical protein [Thermofilum sp.]